MITLSFIVLATAAVLLLGKQIEWWHQRCWALFLHGDLERARKMSFLVIAPGVIIHECAHYLMARLMRRKVVGFSLFSPKYDPATAHWRLGSVTYEEAPEAWRNFLIGAAPLILGPLVLLGLLALLGAPLPESTSPATVFETFVGAFGAAGWKAPLLLYAFLNLGTTVLVSPQDMHHLRPAAFTLIAAIPLGLVLHAVLPTGAQDSIGEFLNKIGAAVLFLLCAMLAADGLAYGALRLIWRLLHLRASRIAAQG